MPEIWVQSLVSARTREPKVSIYWPKDREAAQMTPDEARSLALNILRSAEAAEQDAFLVGFVTEKMKLDDAVAGVFLRDMREWRGQEEGPDETNRPQD